jgi:hypothetical protein
VNIILEIPFVTPTFDTRCCQSSNEHTVGYYCEFLPHRQGISQKILTYKPLKILTSVKNVSFTFKTVGKLHQQFDLLFHELLIREIITKLWQKHWNSRMIGTWKQTPKLRVAALKNLAKIKK